jgi:predicted nucleotidyltransferase
MDPDLRQLRLEAGLTQAQLAELAGVSQPKLSQYERGVTIAKPETLSRILAVARKRPSVLLEENADAVLELARRHHLTNVRVFGSSVHGTDTAASDIDLLVRAESGATLFDLAAFEAEVEELTGYPVDVVTDPASHTPIWDRIVAEAVPL